MKCEPNLLALIAIAFGAGIVLSLCFSLKWVVIASGILLIICGARCGRRK